MDGGKGSQVHSLALVLGTGGVRSAAALGFHDVLVHEKIVPDLIVGCSAGALFGACLALRMQGGSALALAAKLWSPRLMRKRRWYGYAQMMFPSLLGFDRRFSLGDPLPVRRSIDEAFQGHLLESLPTRLRVATTDMASGTGVVLERGSLTDALCAATAIPFILPSVEIGGRHLSDGVVSNPLPVSAAHDAEVAIALSFRGMSHAPQVNKPARLLAQVASTAISNLQEARIRASEMTGRRLLHLNLTPSRHIGLWQTAALPELYEVGVQAALKHLPDIKTLLAVSVSIPRSRRPPS